jgi:hypothetical protein
LEEIETCLAKDGKEARKPKKYQPAGYEAND